MPPKRDRRLKPVKMVSVAITVQPSDLETLERLGRGNVSLGVRELVASFLAGQDWISKPGKMPDVIKQNLNQYIPQLGRGNDRPEQEGE